MSFVLNNAIKINYQGVYYELKHVCIIYRGYMSSMTDQIIGQKHLLDGASNRVIGI